RQVQGAFVAGLERVEHLDDLLTTTRTHVRIVTRPADESGAMNPRLWIKVQLWITRQRQLHVPSRRGFDRRLEGTCMTGQDDLQGRVRVPVALDAVTAIGDEDHSGIA